MGMPKRCVVPITMSAPISPGAFSSVNASRSAAMMNAACLPCTVAASALQSCNQPLDAGYWAKAAK